MKGLWQASPPILSSPTIDVQTLQDHFHLPITGMFSMLCAQLIPDAVDVDRLCETLG